MQYLDFNLWGATESDKKRVATVETIGSPRTDRAHETGNRNGAKEWMQHAPYVCAGYHDFSQRAIFSEKAGVSDKSRGDKPMRLSEIATRAGWDGGEGKT